MKGRESECAAMAEQGMWALMCTCGQHGRNGGCKEGKDGGVGTQQRGHMVRQQERGGGRHGEAT